VIASNFSKETLVDRHFFRDDRSNANAARLFLEKPAQRFAVNKIDRGPSAFSLQHPRPLCPTPAM
jgi:hypothetical protein